MWQAASSAQMHLKNFCRRSCFSIVVNERNVTESGRSGRKPAEAPGKGFAHLSLHCTRLLLLCLDNILLFLVNSCCP